MDAQVIRTLRVQRILPTQYGEHFEALFQKLPLDHTRMCRDVRRLLVIVHHSATSANISSHFITLSFLTTRRTFFLREGCPEDGPLNQRFF